MGGIPGLADRNDTVVLPAVWDIVGCEAKVNDMEKYVTRALKPSFNVQMQIPSSPRAGELRIPKLSNAVIGD